MKRFFDLSVSFIALILLSPLLLPVIILVWLQDWHSPFYIAERIGQNGKPFKMIKLRSMIVNADRSGVDSTSADDQRITKIGHFIRKFKLDELMQLVNVFAGSMSMVGPRPNVKRETDLYTNVERKLLSVKPGITDFSSIVFSDEGEILEGKKDPDLAYNQLIRPGKSLLGLFYIENLTLLLDIKLCFFTAIAIFSRERALQMVCKSLSALKADDELIKLASRQHPLVPNAPPGASKVVSNRTKIVN